MTLREALDALHRAGRLDKDSAAWCYTYDFGSSGLPFYIGRNDPCLTGCLAALAREASGDPMLNAVSARDMSGGIEWLVDGEGLAAGYIANAEGEVWATVLIALAEALP